ncbi:MBL fold metallo-hydrolase [Clostridium sardiniense]|uniref:MBL fold metallo-hydrolase n=1 Tax=Clostridium sardiniense TaxID=29369 RepID=UPI003D3589E3
MLVSLSNRVYYLPHNEETDRPVLGYVRGDKYSLMIDAGNSDKHVRAFMEETQKNNLPYPNYVGITHWHWDHTFGLSSIKTTAIASRVTNNQLKRMTLWKWDDKSMEDRVKNGYEIEFCDNMIKKEYEDRGYIDVRTADIVFDDELTLDLGGVSCEIMRIGGSHSKDSTIYYIPEEKVLFLGDACCEDMYNGEPHFRMEKLYKLIKDLKNIDFKICIEGHSEYTTKEELIEYLESELKIENIN